MKWLIVNVDYGWSFSFWAVPRSGLDLEDKIECIVEHPSLLQPRRLYVIIAYKFNGTLEGKYINKSIPQLVNVKKFLDAFCD